MFFVFFHILASIKSFVNKIIAEKSNIFIIKNLKKIFFILKIIVKLILKLLNNLIYFKKNISFIN